MSFSRPELVTDAPTLAEAAKGKLEEDLPGWSADSDPVTSAILDAGSTPAAEQAEFLELELIEAYKGVGALFGVTANPPQPATALATFTLTNAAPVGGYTIGNGAIVGVFDGNSTLQGFRLVADLAVAEGQASAVGTVEANTPGEDGNNLSGLAVLVDTPPQVASVTLATSGGGEEEEEEADFLERLTEDLQLVSLSAVRAQDAAAVARKVPGVGRATAVDLLKPAVADGGEGSEETGVERDTTVTITGLNGVAPSSPLKAAVLAALNERRLTNQRFYVTGPHYEQVDVTSIVYAWPGADPAQVKLEAEEALRRVVSPATAQTGQSGNLKVWINDPVLRLAEFYGGLGLNPGIRYAGALTFGKHGGSLSTADYTLKSSSKVPALPEPGTISVTVEATS